ncbi:MAG: SAM-dependent methyltransferase [Phenylobacterium sp.]
MARLAAFVVGYQATWIADIGVKSGLFQAIADGGDGISEADVAGRLGLDPRYVQLWCRSAYAFELLEWDPEAGYRLTSEMRTLCSMPPTRCSWVVACSSSPPSTKTSAPSPTIWPPGAAWPRSEHDPWLLEALKNTTKPDSGVWTETVLPQAPTALARLEQGGRMLDIGTGAGFALIHYAHRFPAAQIVGIEFDEPSYELAHQAIGDAGLGDRVEVRHDDANLLADIDTYDLVTMSITLHETGGPDEYRKVLERTHRALKPGGTLLVAELP